MDRTTLPRDLKPLERQGWVSITEGEDRRKRFIALTPDGRDLLKSALPLWEQAKSVFETIWAMTVIKVCLVNYLISLS
ncbi:hypothetical protein [Ammoniphilus sp. 3BR4]|uniref:hypothetical protein n=1 Tax=Ammoniphilus sp. 3BR4 TaxID=3158265 RepID=UPI003464FBEB